MCPETLQFGAVQFHSIMTVHFVTWDARRCVVWKSSWFIFYTFFSFRGPAVPTGPGLPHYRSFTIVLRSTTLGRTPLDEWSARRRDFCLTTHNTHKQQTFMPPAGFEIIVPAIPAAADPHLRPRGRWNCS